MRHELLKLWTLRWTRLGSLIAVAVTAGFSWLSVTALGALPDEPGAAQLDGAQLIDLALRTSTPQLIFAAVLGSLSVSAEVRQGMLAMTLLRGQGRDHVLAAKCGALVSWAGGLGLLGGSVVIAVVAATQEGPTISLARAILVVVCHALVTTFWALGGLVWGTLVSHPGGAVAGALAVPLLLEPLLVQVLADNPGRLLPYRAAASLYEATEGLAVSSFAWSTPALLVIALGLWVARFRLERLDV